LHFFSTSFYLLGLAALWENKTERCAGLHNAKGVITLPEPAASSTAVLLVEGVFSGKPQN